VRQLTQAEEGIKPLPQSSGPRAVLFGLHWLDLGGAERWALETIKLAREAGLLPIVVTDRESHQQWLDKPELDGTVIVPLSFPLAEQQPEYFLRSVLMHFNIVGVVVHHCAWLYDRLPYVRRWRPGVPVVDTLHVIEYAGGGYPATSAHLDPYIDIHHVISPQLFEWFTEVQRIESEKVVLAPLVGLTTASEEPQFSAQSEPGEPFTLGFVGRFVRQKRPYLFLKLVRKLRERGVNVRAILHGSGELDGFIRHHIQKDGLSEHVELRDHGSPVADTLRDIDLLVVSSQNEGITLTTLESLTAGVPVLSADVGSQNTIVDGDLLVPRAPHAFVEASAPVIERLADSVDARRDAWQRQLHHAKRFSERESAQDWMRRTLRQWTE
jgi:glycosyltransferase involved in cell wall biosynthesis